MNIPEELQEAINKELASAKQRSLKEAQADLSSRYLQHGHQRTTYMRTLKDRLAYLAARMPATFAACASAFKDTAARLSAPPRTLLDLGSGPGTALWAASAFFPTLQQMTAWEQDTELASIGKKLALASPLPALRNALWQAGDLQKLDTLPSSDLITLSYVLGELDPLAIPSLIEKAFHAANLALIVIEPGTPAGFARIRTVRDQLIALKGHVIAPCPHMNLCPMTGNDWCHFAARLQRSSTHRAIKEGTLNYEDEKFSYIAFAKSPVPLPSSRILRHPLKRSGHIQFTLCTPDGLQQETISRKAGPLYKQAKEAEWGDSLP